MKQIERMIKMEQIFDEAESVLHQFNKACEDLLLIQDKIQQLDEYYTSSLWRQDYEDDCAGKFPDTLKRGILSEDGIYNLLNQNAKYLKQLEKRDE